MIARELARRSVRAPPEARPIPGPASETLLTADDPPAFRVENPAGASPFVIVCDHAGRAIPTRLGDLGVSPADMDRHIAWDIGAKDVALRLGADLDACVLHQAYSRLVIDCNRPPDHAESVVEVSDGTAVPANGGVTTADRARRVAEIHRPYHDEIDRRIAARTVDGRHVVVVSIHSFTPVMKGFARPWRFGVLHDGRSPFSAAVLQGLRAHGEETGDNEPYSLDDVTDFTVPFHAIRRGLDYLELEIRQDLIERLEGAEAVADLLARVFSEALAGLDPA